MITVPLATPTGMSGDEKLLVEGTFIGYGFQTPNPEIIVFASEAFEPPRSERIPSDD